MKGYLLLIVAFISLSIGGATTGLYYNNKNNVLKLKLEKEVNKNTQNVLVIERLQRDKSNALELKIQAENKAREIVEVIVEKEIIKYVENNTNSSCELDDDWVRIHDSSVPVPKATRPTSQPNEGDSKVQDLGTALGVVTENYNACQDVLMQLKGWQEWYEALQNEYNP